MNHPVYSTEYEIATVLYFIIYLIFNAFLMQVGPVVQGTKFSRYLLGLFTYNLIFDIFKCGLKNQEVSYYSIIFKFSHR